MLFPKHEVLRRGGITISNGVLEESGTDVNNGESNDDGAEALMHVSGTEIGNGIAIGNKLKRGMGGVGGRSVSIAHSRVGKGNEADKRSNSEVGANNV